MRTSDGLKKAKRNKKDEFYTQLVDIEKEMRFYKNKFEGKIVFCNCDDPYESNFFKFFALNFNRLKLKKLVSVSYAGSPIVGEEISLFESQGKEYKITNKRAYKVTLSELKDVTGDGREDLEDVKEIIKHRIRYLKGDGDFRSEESIELLKQADIVVTNPPFSLFREYVTQLMNYKKEFLIIGNINCISYKEVFPLIKNNEVWLGTGMGRWISGFIVPESYELYGTEARINDKGKRIVATNNCLWLTNLDHKKRHDILDLYKEYNSEEYPKYDNYDAINVNKTAEIPCDYDGVMGVPITFLDKYNPDQFEILGQMANTNVTDTNFGYPYVNGKKIYARILIKKK